MWFGCEMTYLTSSLVKGLVAPSVPWCWQWQRECGQTPGCSLPSEASCRAALVNHTPSQSVCVCVCCGYLFSPGWLVDPAYACMWIRVHVLSPCYCQLHRTRLQYLTYETKYWRVPKKMFWQMAHVHISISLSLILSLSLCLCVSVTRSVLTSCYQEIQSNHIQSPMQKKAKDQLGEWHLKQSTLEVFNHLTALNSSFQLSIAITASHQLLGPWWHPKMTRDTTEKYHVLPFWRYYCYTESMYKYTVYPNLWLVSIQISMCLISQQIQPLSRPPSVPPREPFATARWCARQAEAWEGQGTGTRSRPRTWSKAMFFGRISHRKRVEKNHQIWKELVFWGVIRILISPKFGAAGALNHSALQDRLNTSR